MKKSQIGKWSVGLVGGALLAGVGCGMDPASSGLAGEPFVSEDPAITTENGLNSVNGLSSTNGLNSVNGLSSTNGLNSVNGLQNKVGLMSTAAGRDTVAYLIRCALPPGRSITKLDEAGVSHTYGGQIGVAPEWETAGCGTSCQELVSACLLAHINTTGQHIPLWLDGDSPNVGWGQSTSFPFQEGSFYGNLFTSPPKAYYCDGKDFAFGVVPGRIGATQAGAPYTNPLGTNVLCKYRCTAANTSGDGFSSCPGYGADKFSHVMTVWRNFEPATAYKICNRSSTKCLGAVGSSKTSGAQIGQYTYSSSLAGAKWNVIQVSPGKYKVVNVNSGLALSTAGGAVADGTALVQLAYSSAATQIWSVKSMADTTGFFTMMPSSSTTAAATVPTSALSTEGAVVGVSAYFMGDYQKWAFTLAN